MNRQEVKLPTVAIVGGKEHALQPIPLMKRSGLFSSLLKDYVTEEGISILPDIDTDSPAFELVWMYLNGGIDTYTDIIDYFPSLKEIDWGEVWKLFDYLMVPLDLPIMKELYFNVPEFEGYMGDAAVRLVEDAIAEKSRSEWKEAMRRRKIELLYDTRTPPPPIIYTHKIYTLEGYTLDDIVADPGIIERETKYVEPDELFFIVEEPKYNLERDLLTSLFGRSIYAVEGENDLQFYHAEDLQPVSREVMEAFFYNKRATILDSAPPDNKNIVTSYEILR
jgi:hypothetical protein